MTGGFERRPGYREVTTVRLGDPGVQRQIRADQLDSLGVGQRVQLGPRRLEGGEPLGDRATVASGDIEDEQHRGTRRYRIAGGAVGIGGGAGHVDRTDVILDVGGLVRRGLEDGAAIRRRNVLRHVGDRPEIQLDRLTVGRQAGRLPGTGERRVEGLAAKAGPFEVQRGMYLRLAFQLRPEFAGPA